MEFNEEVFLQQQRKDLNFQSPWFPSTPAKPAPIQRPSISGNGHNHLKSPEPNCPRSMQVQTRSPGVGVDAVSTDCSASSSSNNSSEPIMLTYNNTPGGWKQTSGTNLVGCNVMTASSRNPFFTLLLQSQIGDVIGTQVHPNKFLLDRVPPNPNLYNGISPSTPKSIESAVSVGVISGAPSSFTLDTMEKNKHMKECLNQEVISLVQETVTRGKTLVCESGKWPPQIAKQVELCFLDNMVSLSEQEQVEVTVISSEQGAQLLKNAEKHELENQGIDLNRTPEKKPKRRKHRPKVIREGKPVRTPKPRTPNPITTKMAMINEKSPTGKRKYVRKKIEQSSTDAHSSMLTDIVDVEDTNSRKSVRRCLNFNSEPLEAQDACPGLATMTSMHCAHPQTLASHLERTNSNSSRMSTTQIAQQSDAVVENGDSGMPFDLNCSANQMPYGYIRFPEKQNPTLQPCRQENFRTNQILDCSESTEKVATPLSSKNKLISGSDVDKNSNCVNSATAADRNQETSEIQSDSGGISCVILKQTKRSHNVPQDSCTSNYRDFMHAFSGIGQLNECPDMSGHDLFSPTKSKKNKTENKHSELNNHQMTLGERQASEQILALNKIDKKISEITVQSHESNSISYTSDVIHRTAPLNNHEMLSPVKSFRHNDREAFENQNFKNAHLGTNSKTKPKRRTKKGQDQLANPPLPSTYQLGFQGHLADSSNIDSSIVKKIHDPSALVSGEPRDPLDDITEQIKHMTITETHEDAIAIAENALVPYVGGGMIVPHMGQFYIARKQRIRPKVDLDEESFRVWNLLMGKGCNDSMEEKDSEKEKRWEEERKVFHGRVDSFIARMHLVQGDRRFSKWKGSVVDSVVGVFLTQNVADHLSSSAFMALAARFPLKLGQNNKAANGEKKDIYMEMQERCTVSLDYSGKLQDYMLSKDLHHVGSQVIMGENESSNSNESVANGVTECSRKFVDTHDTVVAHKPPQGSLAGISALTGRWSFDDVASSQNSVVSSQNSENQVQTTDRNELNSQPNLQNEELLTGRMSNGLGSSTSFVELLMMAERILPEKLQSVIARFDNPISEKMSSMLDPSCSLGISSASSGHCCFNNYSTVKSVDIMSASDKIRSKKLSEAPRMINMNEDKLSETTSVIQAIKNIGQQKLALVPNKLEDDSCASKNNHLLQPENISVTEASIEMKLYHNYKFQREERETSTSKSISQTYSHVLDEDTIDNHQKEDAKLSENMERNQSQIQNPSNQQEFTNLCNKERYPLEVFRGVETTLKNEACNSQRVSAGTLEEKKVKFKKDKKGTYDWDILRKGVHRNGTTKERNNDTMDSIDWEAVRCAEVKEISDSIRERGMNNKLAERIKDFLNRLVEDHGSIDLEWLRDVEPGKAKDYLLSIQGLGLKSVECVRLLTLQQLAFPVDTNVGRICVRLGWVPLQPLPESLQLHLLELYPMLETIQKYLWPRLCKLDQRTLYELHYQLITFGKVFCTKNKPNCNACPMRAECKHFASAFASARLALPGPEEKTLASSTAAVAYEINCAPDLQPVRLPQIEDNRESKDTNCCNSCEPIVEEPSTPEAEQEDTEENAIEDIFYDDPDEIPTIKLNFKEFTQNLHNYIQEHNLEVKDGDMSKALVAIDPEAASIPMPKLKNVSRLRTEHHVYELPDSHPLLEGVRQHNLMNHLQHSAAPREQASYVTTPLAFPAIVYEKQRLKQLEEQFW
ncbi:protein ROS1-like isoform X2 [Canna indica]|uniref:Protein ROS1-like isoform X2 n=1 Tax=Canna indica TaxID=4628 RepID=A0AAQ3K987_9LILI|nr:protein ROS1-like isoform X2 [Canna indica]